MLRNADKAPAFSLQNQTGTAVDLASFDGKPLVIIFVRGAFCPTTNRFLTAYQDFYKRIQDLGMELVSISTDDVATAAGLKEKLSLTFPLLSDSDGSIAKSYGVYLEQKRSGGTFAEPAVFIIDQDGEIAYYTISSGPKGLPDPGAIAPILIYMHANGGKY